MRCYLGLLVFLLASSAFAADLSGIWMGQQPGRNGETDDVAFQFKLNGEALTGTLFGDEFDLPITEGTLTGDQVRFTVTTTNYYSGRKMKFIYTGTLKGNSIELTRERIPAPDEKAGSRGPLKQTLKLTRIASATERLRSSQL
jgi:hypothetical protein